MKKIICILLLFAALPVCSRAQSRNAVETSTDILMFLPSGVGGVVSLAEGLGVDFDKVYYESQTYLLGKSLVEEGLQKGIFFRKEDNSVWIDLAEDGLDQKLLLRGDGTSVYMTQDLGTAYRRFEDNNLDGIIYVVGNEQNYHFQVLKLILKKLGYEWSDGIYHLSYGMVELPEGKMKSREGTVVDADTSVLSPLTPAIRKNAF